MPQEQHAAGIAISAEAIQLKTSTGEIYAVTMEECGQAEGPIPALLYTQLLLMSDLQKTMQGVLAVLQNATAQAEAMKGFPEQARDDALDRIMAAFESMPQKPPGFDQMMAALRGATAGPNG